MRAKWTYALPYATLLGLLACALVGAYLWHIRHAVKDMESAQIFEQGPGSQGTTGLKANLRAVRMVVPDRPHDPMDTQSPEGRAKITRRRVFHLSTEAHGFRGEDDVAAKASGPRVVIVGDSVALGWGVDDDLALGAQLAERLGVEVVTSAAPGLDATGLEGWVRRTRQQVGGDLYIIAKGRGSGGQAGWAPFVSAVRAASPARAMIALHPVSTFDVRALTEPQAIPADPPAPLIDLTPVFDAARRAPGVVLRVSHDGQAMVDLATGKELARGRPEQLDKLAPEIIAAFEADDAVSEPLFYDGGHPDAEGYALYAQALADFIRDAGLLTLPSGR